jgi:hypothetical protein
MGNDRSVDAKKAHGMGSEQITKEAINSNHMSDRKE